MFSLVCSANKNVGIIIERRHKEIFQNSGEEKLIRKAGVSPKCLGAARRRMTKW
jgi:hypothetical protein